MIPTVTSKRTPSTIDSYPQSLRDGAERLVGLIDGYPSYYDRRHHRIDVLLEDTDGTAHLSEYYRLQPNETVSGYVRKAERNGYDCDVLARWTPRRNGSGSHAPTTEKVRRRARVLSVRIVRWARRLSEHVR